MLTDKELENIKKASSQGKVKYIKKFIFCATNNKTYKNALEASLDTGICRASIYSCCYRGQGEIKQGVFRGWKFEFVGDDL